MRQGGLYLPTVVRGPSLTAGAAKVPHTHAAAAPAAPAAPAALEVVVPEGAAVAARYIPKHLGEVPTQHSMHLSCDMLPS